jgi:hypothetical protein
MGKMGRMGRMRASMSAINPIKAMNITTGIGGTDGKRVALAVYLFALGMGRPNRIAGHREAALVDIRKIMRRICKPFIINGLQRPFLRDGNIWGKPRNFQKISRFCLLFGIFRPFSGNYEAESAYFVPLALEAL